MPDASEDRVLNLSEAAKYVSMSESYVAAHATRPNKSPRISYIRIGNRLKFRRSDLDRFVEECAAKTNAAKKAE